MTGNRLERRYLAAMWYVDGRSLIADPVASPDSRSCLFWRRMRPVFRSSPQSAGTDNRLGLWYGDLSGFTA